MLPCPLFIVVVKKKQKKKPQLIAPVVCIDMNLFPRQNEEFTAAWKGPPCGARMTWSAVLLLPLLVGFRRGQLECNNEMEKFQRSEHLHADGNWRLPPKNSARYAFNSTPQ